MTLPKFPFPGTGRGRAVELKITIRDEGEPNFFSIMKNGRWICQVQFNGEFTVSQQLAMVRIMANAMESEKVLDNLWPRP